MKAIFGFAVFLLFLAGIAFVMMQGRQMARTGSSGAEITGIEWRPVSIGTLVIPEVSTLHVRFEVDGSVKGHGGCNGFFSSLQQTDSGVEVGPLGSTRMACPEEIMDRETAFLDAVQRTRGFATGGDELDLLDEGGQVLATLTATAGSE